MFHPAIELVDILHGREQAFCRLWLAGKGGGEAVTPLRLGCGGERFMSRGGIMFFLPVIGAVSMPLPGFSYFPVTEGFFECLPGDGPFAFFCLAP
jgi:hypothetical protein